MSKYAPREWAPDEKPMLPGSPSTPAHPTPLRFAYLFVGILVTITGGLGNALVAVNLVNLQGALGAYSTETAWLPAAYVMANASMNLLLVTFRQQFGLRLQMANVRLGQPVSFTVDALNNATLRGHVERIAPATGSNEVLRVAHNRYRNGYASYLEELDAQRNAFSAGNTVLQLRASLLAAHVDLYRALGGGWRPAP